MGQLRALLDLPVTVGAPASARAVVAAVLPLWGLEDLVDTARLVVSELVTNAVQHASGSETVELELVRRAAGVRIALADGSTVEPVARALDADAPSGRGVYLIEALASRWGTESRRGGKQVWVDVDRADWDQQ